MRLGWGLCHKWSLGGVSWALWTPSPGFYIWVLVSQAWRETCSHHAAKAGTQGTEVPLFPEDEFCQKRMNSSCFGSSRLLHMEVFPLLGLGRAAFQSSVNTSEILRGSGTGKWSHFTFAAWFKLELHKSEDRMLEFFVWSCALGAQFAPVSQREEVGMYGIPICIIWSSRSFSLRKHPA